MEKIVTDLLNELIRCPDRVQPAASQAAAACGKTREELTSALERQPIDEDNARALLLQLAAEQYDAIGNTEYETVRLRRLLTGRKPMTEPEEIATRSPRLRLSLAALAVRALEEVAILMPMKPARQE